MLIKSVEFVNPPSTTKVQFTDRFQEEIVALLVQVRRIAPMKEALRVATILLMCIVMNVLADLNKYSVA